MPRKRVRIPMFFKFLAGCMLLALLMIIGGGLLFRAKSRMENRGNYLEKHFQRYLEYQQGLGKAVSSVAELMASELLLRRALVDPRPADTPSATELAAQSFDILRGKNNIQPDLMLVFDGTGNLVWSRLVGASEAASGSAADPAGGNQAGATGSFDAQDLGAMRAVHLVRDGSSYYDKVLIHEGRAYQVAGVPIRAPDGRNIVGGLILGVGLERYMRDFKQQSDSKEHMQYRLTLFHEGKVVASVMEPALWPELEDNLPHSKNAWKRANDPGRFKQPYVALSAGEYDIYGGQSQDMRGGLLQGFAGLEDGNVGELYLIRSRANLADRKPHVPWAYFTIATILATLVALGLALVITLPIKSFVVQTRKLLEGETDLTQRIELDCRDELGDLAENINQVFERLYHLASDVQNAAFQVGASSAEISAASKQMLSGLKDQTLKISGSTAAVTELSASIQQVAANAAEATKVAEKSNDAVTSAVARMQEIRGAVEEAADKMQELGESSKRIGNIVEVIRQISEQTSLLALNASIEAAHAGEQGRGFAVVADEVSSLARRVGQSAKDIEALIQTIKEQTAEAVTSMQIGTREVEEGTHLVTATLTDLGNLIHVVKETATAVKEQAQVSDEIARNMDAVQHIASEVLSGSEESVGQAEQLHELAFALEHSVNGFNIDGAQAGGRSSGPPSVEQTSLPASPQRALPDRSRQRSLPARRTRGMR